MAISKQTTTAYGVYDYWAISDSYSFLAAKSDEITVILDLYASRDYRHTGYQFYQRESVIINLTEYLEDYKITNDRIKSIYNLILKDPNWSDAASILEPGQ